MPRYCYVYVLRSVLDRQFYVGLTRKLSGRIEAHNRGLVNSTKKRRPFELVYWEACLNESDAARREVFENGLGKKIHQNSTEKLSHGVKNPRRNAAASCEMPTILFVA